MGFCFISNKNNKMATESAHACFSALGASDFALLGCMVHPLDDVLAPLDSVKGPLGLQEEANSLLGPYRLLTRRGSAPLLRGHAGDR